MGHFLFSFHLNSLLTMFWIPSVWAKNFSKEFPLWCSYLSTEFYTMSSQFQDRRAPSEVLVQLLLFHALTNSTTLAAIQQQIWKWFLSELWKSTIHINLSMQIIFLWKGCFQILINELKLLPFSHTFRLNYVEL